MVNTTFVDRTNDFDSTDVKNNLAMGIVAYLGPLFLIPLFAAKESPSSRFHANQGLVLFICECVWGIASTIIGTILSLIGLFFINIIFRLVNLAFLAAMVYEIVMIAQNKVIELPFIGQIKLFK